jgi:hypothetical protein
MFPIPTFFISVFQTGPKKIRKSHCLESMLDHFRMIKVVPCGAAFLQSRTVRYDVSPGTIMKRQSGLLCTSIYCAQLKGTCLEVGKCLPTRTDVCAVLACCCIDHPCMVFLVLCESMCMLRKYVDFVITIIFVEFSMHLKMSIQHIFFLLGRWKAIV